MFIRSLVLALAFFISTGAHSSGNCFEVKSPKIINPAIKNIQQEVKTFVNFKDHPEFIDLLKKVEISSGFSIDELLVAFFSTKNPELTPESDLSFQSQILRDMILREVHKDTIKQVWGNDLNGYINASFLSM